MTAYAFKDEIKDVLVAGEQNGAVQTQDDGGVPECLSLIHI